MEMRKIMQIRLENMACSVLLLSCVTLSIAATNPIQNKEKVIFEKFLKSEFYDINYAFSDQAKQLIKRDGTASFHYDFPLFQENYGLSIEYPPDRTFKTYTFDMGSGGTMREFETFIQFRAQFRTQSKASLVELDTGYVLNIEQILLNQKPVYLIQSYYKSSNCTGMYSIQAFKFKNNQFINANIFHTKNKAFNQITVDYHCQRTLGNENRYIQLSKDKKILNVQFLDPEYRPEAQYLRYVLKPNGYVYQGVFKQ